MGMKRANGTGSVYKIKHKSLRKPYKAVLTIGWTDDGKRIRKTLGYFEKSKDALNALAEYQFNPDKYNNQHITFADAWNWMIDEKKRNGVDIIKGRYDSIKKKLTPIWHLPMQQIKLAHLQAIFDSYSHLGRSSHESLLKAINGAFKEAIKNDVINKNYASMITITSKEKSTIHKPFTENEIAILWQYTDIKLVKMLLIYIYTGMRPTELFEVKLSNVFLKERYLIGGIKTAAGINRIIPIAKCIMPFIEELYTLASFKRSDTLIPLGYIPQRFDRQLSSLCKNLNISDHKRHDTRHTFITMSSNVGVDEYIIKTIVGHTHNGNITREVYIHKSTEQLIHAVDKLPIYRLSHGRATQTK